MNILQIQRKVGLLSEKFCAFKKHAHIRRMPRICNVSNGIELFTSFRLKNQNVVKQNVLHGQKFRVCARS